MRGLIFCILSFFLTGHASAASLNKNQEQQRILIEINAYRAQQNLSPLALDSFISKIAETHSRQMAAGLPFSHEGFAERSKHLFSHFQQVRGVAENIAYTNMQVDSVIKPWLLSPGHRKNIVGDYNFTGIGLAQDKDGRIFVTQIFIKEDL